MYGFSYLSEVWPLKPQFDTLAAYRSALEQNRAQYGIINARYKEANDKIQSLNKELEKTT